MVNRVRFSAVFLSAIMYIFTGGITTALAGINDHFNNGQLDPAWEVVCSNATGWSYAESGTKLTVSDIGIQNSSNDGAILLRQNFSAAGDFEIKSGISWDSEGRYSTMQILGIRAYSGANIVVQGGYCDWWVAFDGQRFARIAEPLYWYDSGLDTVPSAGSAEITLKRTNGLVSALWNDNVMLTGYCNSAVDKLELIFVKDNYPSGNFGTLSVDYVTAVPEPATMLLLGLGVFGLIRKDSHPMLDSRFATSHGAGGGHREKQRKEKYR